MAERLAIPSKEVQLVVVGPRDSFKASRIQRVSLNTEQQIDTKDELGNRQHVGNVKDTPNITLTFSAFDVSIKIFAALTGTDPNAYPGTGVDIQNLSEIDAILQVKDATVEDYVKTIHGHKLQVRDFTFNYAVDGDSTEEYTAIGSSRRYLKYDVIVDKFATGTSFTLSQTPIQLKNGNYALSVVVDGEYVTEVSGAPATGEYRVVGTTLTTGDSAAAQVLAVYHANPAGTNWTDVSDALIPIAIRGKDVKIEIAANSISRVQSVSINGNLNVTAVKELGNRDVVGYQRQVPTIEGTITVLDTDTDLISLLSEGTIGSGMEWQPGDANCATTPLELKIELVDPCDEIGAPTVLKTVLLPEITITSDGYTSNVNDNATVTFGFRSEDAQCIVYSGEPA